MLTHDWHKPAGPHPRHRQATPPYQTAFTRQQQSTTGLSRSISADGWLLLADDTWRLLHHYRTGSLAVEASIARIALSAAMLGELLLADHIAVQTTSDHTDSIHRDAYLLVIDRTPPIDPLAHDLLQRIDRETQPVTVREWLLYLAGADFHGGMYEQVAQRMIHAGHIVADRRLLRPVIFRPTNRSIAEWPVAGLSTCFNARRPFTKLQLILASIAFSTGRSTHVFLDQNTAANRSIPPLIRQLPVDVVRLLDQLETAISDAVLHGR